MNRRKFLVSTAVVPIAMLTPYRAHAANSHIHLLEGMVTTNNQRITMNTNIQSAIQSGDEITVSQNAKLIFSVGKDAFLVRGGTVFSIISDSDLLISSLRLITGAILGVFGPRVNTTRIITSTAIIGIRGTAVYVEATPHLCYTCTCYGHTDLIVANQREDVKATHHNAHVVTSSPAGTLQMQAFEVKGHTDAELRMLEALVGRKPKFDT